MNHIGLRHSSPLIHDSVNFLDYERLEVTTTCLLREAIHVTVYTLDSRLVRLRRAFASVERSNLSPYHTPGHYLRYSTAAFLHF